MVTTQGGEECIGAGKMRRGCRRSYWWLGFPRATFGTEPSSVPQAVGLGGTLYLGVHGIYLILLMGDVLSKRQMCCCWRRVGVGNQRIEHGP